MERLYERGHLEHFNRLKKFIYAPHQRAILNIPTHTPSQPYRSSPNQQSTNVQNKQSVTGTMPSQPFSIGRLTFKDSPFYTIIEALTPAIECKAREQTRDSVELKVVLNTSVAARLQSETNLRVMVYCAADTGLTPFSNSDISFPHQVELKTNLDDVKANLRGLKNKPGSTRPADVTSYIRKKAGYTNHVVMTYALTQKCEVGLKMQTSLPHPVLCH
jgi:E3 SUMO-protein ligase PIAS1